MVKSDLVRKQHVVSKFYLKAFTDDSDMLLRTVLTDSQNHPVSVSKASVIGDFYSFRDADGNLNDYFERQFSKIEGPASLVHRAVVEDELWPLSEDEKYAFGAWVALQFLRSEGMRNQGKDVYALVIQLMVSLSGKEALKKHIEVAEGELVSDERLEFEWDELTRYGGPRLKAGSEDHLSSISTLIEPTTKLVVDKPWTLLVYRRKRIITCDHPISILPDPDESPVRGVGFGNAAAYFLPLSRRHVLLIGGTQETSHAPLRGNAAFANSANQWTAANARTAIYSHPDDADVIRALTLPEPREWEISPDETSDFLRKEDLWPKDDVNASVGAQSLPVMEGMGSSFRLSDVQWPIPGRLNSWKQ